MADPPRSQRSERVASCSWDRPGHDAYMGDVVAAVDRYDDIPLAVRTTLKRRMQARQYDDVAEIRRDSIAGRRAYDPQIRDMHFGTGRVCATVSRDQWTAQTRERGLVYCEGEQCILVPTICRNVSRVTRRPEAVAAGKVAAVEPLKFDPPSAGAPAPVDASSTRITSAPEARVAASPAAPPSPSSFAGGAGPGAWLAPVISLSPTPVAPGGVAPPLWPVAPPRAGDVSDWLRGGNTAVAAPPGGVVAAAPTLPTRPATGGSGGAPVAPAAPGNTSGTASGSAGSNTDTGGGIAPGTDSTTPGQPGSGNPASNPGGTTGSAPGGSTGAGGGATPIGGGTSGPSSGSGASGTPGGTTSGNGGTTVPPGGGTTVPPSGGSGLPGGDAGGSTGGTSGQPGSGPSGGNPGGTTGAGGGNGAPGGDVFPGGGPIDVVGGTPGGGIDLGTGGGNDGGPPGGGGPSAPIDLGGTPDGGTPGGGGGGGLPGGGAGGGGPIDVVEGPPGGGIDLGTGGDNGTGAGGGGTDPPGGGGVGGIGDGNPSSGDGIVTSPIPEPSTWASLLLGLAFLVALQRRAGTPRWATQKRS